MFCSSYRHLRCEDAMLCSRNGSSKGREADRKNVVWEVLNLSEYSLQSSVGVIRLFFNFVLHLKRRCSTNDKLN